MDHVQRTLAPKCHNVPVDCLDSVRFTQLQGPESPLIHNTVLWACCRAQCCSDGSRVVVESESMHIPWGSRLRIPDCLNKEATAELLRCCGCESVQVGALDRDTGVRLSVFQ